MGSARGSGRPGKRGWWSVAWEEGVRGCHAAGSALGDSVSWRMRGARRARGVADFVAVGGVGTGAGLGTDQRTLDVAVGAGLQDAAVLLLIGPMGTCDVRAECWCAVVRATHATRLRLAGDRCDTKCEE